MKHNDINYFDEERQIYSVLTNYKNISLIKNPSKQVQYAAIRTDVRSINLLLSNNVPIIDEVLLTAIKIYGAWILELIENPNETFIFKAVQVNAHSISYVENPSEEVQLASVKAFPWSITHIQNPSEKVQIAAIENKWDENFYILNVEELPGKTPWFYREFNRLKLIKGPLK